MFLRSTFYGPVTIFGFWDLAAIFSQAWGILFSFCGPRGYNRQHIVNPGPHHKHNKYHTIMRITGSFLVIEIRYYYDSGLFRGLLGLKCSVFKDFLVEILSKMKVFNKTHN
jgi:hypothetical protein